MWTLRFVAKTENSVIGKIAAKHQVVVQLYPLLTNRTENDTLINSYGIVFGSEKQKSEFLKDFKNLTQLQQIKIYENSFICKYKEKQDYLAFYNPETIFVEPWTIDGIRNKHFLTLGSWNRKTLVNILNNVQSGHKTNLLMLKVSKMTTPSLVFCNVSPRLTSKQRIAMELATTHGYYEYPRKTSVEKLAKIAGLSFSTFQAHLRKAEKKVIPYSHQFIFNDKYR